MPPSAPGLLVVALLAVALPGCFSTPGGSLDPAIVKQASLVVVNEETAFVDVSYASTVNDRPVDSRHYRVNGNATATLSLGLPAQGNTILEVTRNDHGEAWRTTVAAGSCATLDVKVFLRDGGVHAGDLTCRAN